MAISSTLQASSQENQEKMSVFKRKLAHKRPTTSSQFKPMKKVRFAVSPEQNEDVKNLPIECYEGTALERANDIQARLSPPFPSFVKQMLKSHVSGGFWLGLPKGFCVKYLPMVDDVPGIPGVAVYLEDECGKTSKTKYLVEKTGLSGGWRGFSIDHSLADGDVLVFQLIEPCRLKVHICRGNGPAETVKPISVRAPIEDEDDDDEDAETDASDNTMDDSLNVSDKFHDLSPEVLDEGITNSVFVGEFNDVKTLDDFKIVVDGIELNSEIPTNIRAKYYHLCTTQNDFLHRHFNARANNKLAVGMICEIVNISDAARIAKLTTPLEDLKIWDKTLKAFEGAGMAVGFLREHISKLIALHSEQVEMVQRKMAERAELEEERKYFKAKIANAKGEIDRLDIEIKALQVQNAAAELAFLEMANAPW